MFKNFFLSVSKPVLVFSFKIVLNIITKFVKILTARIFFIMRLDIFSHLRKRIHFNFYISKTIVFNSVLDYFCQYKNKVFIICNNTRFEFLNECFSYSVKFIAERQENIGRCNFKIAKKINIFIFIYIFMQGNYEKS